MGRLLELAAGFPGGFSGSFVDLIGLISQLELVEHHPVGTEGVGLYRVAADGQKGSVYVQDHVRACKHQNLDTVLEVVVVGDREFAPVDGGTHRPVEYQHALSGNVENVRVIHV